MTHQQRLQLLELLAQGPEAFGFRGDVWTQPRVAQVIRRHFGVQYHPSQAGRILKQYRWSRQKPIRRGQQRHEEAIRRWKEERAGLLALVVKTYAPRGKTPVLRASLSRDHLSVISGITAQG